MPSKPGPSKAARAADDSRREAFRVDDEEVAFRDAEAPLATLPSTKSLRAEVRLLVTFAFGLVVLLAALLRRTDGRRARGEMGKFARVNRAFVLSMRRGNGTECNELLRLRLQLAALELRGADVEVFFAPPTDFFADVLEGAEKRSIHLKRTRSKNVGFKDLVHAVLKWAEAKSQQTKRPPIAILLEDDAVLLPGAVSVLNDAIEVLESTRRNDWDLLYAAHCGECGWWADPLTPAATAQLGGGANADRAGIEAFARNRSEDAGCGARARGTALLPSDVARAVAHRAVSSLASDTAALAEAVDPRCTDALVLRLSPRLEAILANAVDGSGPKREADLGLTLAALSAAKELKAFVIWPPIVHRLHDGYGRPDDGYGMNSAQFIPAWLERRLRRPADAP